MAEQLSNFGASTLLLPLTAEAVSLTLVTDGGDTFPSSGDFRIRIDDELMLCSARAGDVITIDERGTEETSATTHAADAEVFQVVTKTGLDNYISERVGVGDTGEQGPPGSTTKTFEQEGEARLATGSKPFPLPFDADILSAYPYCGTPPTVDPIEVDVKVNNVSVWADAADRPTIPVSAYNGDPVAPDATPYDAGDRVTVDITSVGAPSSAGGTLSVRDTSTGYNTFTGFTTGSAFNIPIPASYQVGDLLICFFAVLTDSASFYPTGWNDLVTPVVDANLSLRLYCIAKDAESSESATQSVSLTGNAPVQAVTLALANAQVFAGQPDDSDINVHDTNSTTSQVPALTVAEDNGLGLWAYSQRLGSGVTSTITLDGELTEEYSDTTTRSSATNVVLAIGSKYYADAATTTAYTATGSGTGRWCSLGVTVLDGPTADTPGEDVSVEIVYRERT